MPILEGSRVSLKPFMLVRASPFLRLRSDRRAVSTKEKNLVAPEKSPYAKSDFVESQRTISYKNKSNSDYYTFYILPKKRIKN